jgi:glycine cleavage system transcriptional repressor
MGEILFESEGGLNLKSHAILTAVGADRVGIVDDLTALILEGDCNVEESRMAVLGGEFAVILLLSGSREDVRALVQGLPSQEDSLGLQITMRETVPPQAGPDTRPYLLESVSLDTPGIVHSITSLLRRHGINIDDLETDTTPAPWTGAPMFVMKARVILPPSVSIPALREELEALEGEQNLDIKLAPISPPQVEL